MSLVLSPNCGSIPKVSAAELEAPKIPPGQNHYYEIPNTLVFIKNILTTPYGCT